MTSSKASAPPQAMRERAVREQPVLVLQGGGALGAYQAGAYEALAAGGQTPEWIAGISIGAINAAIIAGNTPANRVARLREFWETVSSGLQGFLALPGNDGRQLFNETSSWLATVGGIPGFFAPRHALDLAMPWLSAFTSPWLPKGGETDLLSYYDTTPLRQTLENLIDFELLNTKGPRLSVGAVHIKSGNLAYFDSATQRIGPEHIMASGALPPGFPPVIIKGEAYWDGGLVSNTPLQYVLDADDGTRKSEPDLCIFQIDLFSAKGELPRNLADVAEREKEIRYSSRTRANTTSARDLMKLRQAAKRLIDKLPAAMQDNADAQFLLREAHERAVTIVHLIHRPTSYDTQSKDVEFSRLSVNEHWEAGAKDVQRTLANARWRNRRREEGQVNVLDLAHPKA
jgi:NTE family protein